MDKIFAFFSRIFFFAAAIFFCNPTITGQNTSGVLQIEFTQITASKGNIMLGIYDRESAFMDPAQARLLKVLKVTQVGSIALEISELSIGTYAISAYHDINGNGKIDKNLLGIPTEPYAFSNNARPRFRAPNWDEAKTDLSKNGSRVVLKLEKW